MTATPYELALLAAPAVAIPAPRPAGDDVSAVRALKRRLLVPAARAEVEVSPLAVTVTPSVAEWPTTFEDGRGRRWLLAEALADPAMRHGGIVVPRLHLDRLRRLETAGGSVDFLVAAHELPDSWAPGMPLPRLVPPAPRTVGADRVVVQTGHRLLVLGRLIVWATAAVAAAPVAAIASLDPVLLGGVLSDDRSLTAWAVLAAWTWDDVGQ